MSAPVEQQPERRAPPAPPRQAPPPTMKDKVLATPSFRQFRAAIQSKPALQGEWVSFTSRPWVAGPVDAFLGNPHLACLMRDNPELEVAVDRVIATADGVLRQGGNVPWLVHVVQRVAEHSGIYLVVEACEGMLGPHRIARLEEITGAALTRPRVAKLVAVLAALTTPGAVDGLLQLLKACFTDERIDRLVDAAEFVLSDEDRLRLADLALDQLSGAATDDGILHAIAALDAAADVQLLLQTSQELLAWLLADPEAAGRSLGALLDDVAEPRRLRRAVERGDRVMTLERVAVMGKVLAQLSPAFSPDNISAAAAAAREAVASRRLQRWAGEAASSVAAEELRAWRASVDGALTADAVAALLHLAESLLDGGRVWALLGQPQPMLELWLLADEEARAAACRSGCGRTGDAGGEAGSGAPGSPRGSPRGSRDEWDLVSLSGDGESRSPAQAAAAAAAAAPAAAAVAAAAAPSCGIHDTDCRECSGRCGSEVERMFASGAGLSDAHLQELVRHYLQVCAQPRRRRRREVASQAAQAAAVSAFANAGMGGVVPSGSLSSLSSHLWELDGFPLGSAFGEHERSAADDAAASAAAAAAVAAAARAHGDSACQLNNAPRAAGDGDGEGDGQALLRHYALEGAVAAARVVLRPRRLRQLVGLLPDLLAPQRVAVGLAVLDSALGIGEREVSLGPSCELRHGGGGNGGRGQQATGRARLPAPRAAALAMSLPRALPPALLDAAVGAAVQVAAAPRGRALLLRAADTSLALLAVQQAAKLRAAGGSSSGGGGGGGSPADGGGFFNRAAAAAAASVGAASPPAAGGEPATARAAPAQRVRAAAEAAAHPRRAATAATARARAAAAVASCALGDAGSCVLVEAAAPPGEPAGAPLAATAGGRAELLATMSGLHLSLFRDLWGLWWQYHTNLALSGGQR